MGRNWHEIFSAWAKPPSETEEEKGSNAANMIREAIRAHAVLRTKNVDVYPTGSYRNNTNTRGESDIDIAVVLRDSFGYDLPPAPQAVRDYVAGLRDADYGLAPFRDHVFAALVMKFGQGSLRVGNKTIDVRATSYRLDADVTPFQNHHRYTGRKNSDGTWHHDEGVELRPGNAPLRKIVNWHQQHYDNGVKKNERTNRRFKRVVRILKRMRDEMAGQLLGDGGAIAKRTPSFLVECLVYNVPDAAFNRDQGTYYHDVRETIATAWHSTTPQANAASLTEVNGIKPLFSQEQAWSQADAHAFLLAAWRYASFE